MATKLYNSHLATIIKNSSACYILDTYIALAHISSEIKDKFIIQTYDDTKSDLINLVKKYVPATYKTISNCIDKLKELNILDYDYEINNWLLKDMEFMTKKKSYDENSDISSDYYTGYTNIRPFFLDNKFHKMKGREKRILVTMATLKDSKASVNYNGFQMNFKNKNSIWYIALNTKCEYYAQSTINSMKKKYPDIMEDISDTFVKDYEPKKISRSKFAFKVKVITNYIKNEDSMFDDIALLYPNDYSLVKDRIKLANIKLSKTKILHIIRAIAPLSNWNIKTRVLSSIIQRYVSVQINKTQEDIKSLPRYMAAIIKSVIEEFRTPSMNITHCSDEDNTLNNAIESNLAFF